MKKGWVILFVLGVTALLTWVGIRVLPDEARVREYLSGVPLFPAVVMFVAAYVLSSFVVVDIKDLFKIVAALVFGVLWSTLFIWIAEIISNIILFHLARRVGRGWIERRFSLQGRDVRLVESMCGLGQIFILRTIPIVPYRILDLAYGLTAVPFRRYFLVSALASPVRIFWLQAILAGVGGAVLDPVKMQAYLLENPQILTWSAGYLVFSIVMIGILSKRRV
ncbi:MAG: TVP38/TMEM64 family protein [Elusimicrobia bacterium]|nr:TVP38/TMEM64 family protein [Elusimicrobiota bacterium]